MDIGLNFSFLYLYPDLSKGITRAIFKDHWEYTIKKR